MYGITQSTLDTGRVKIFYFAYSQWEGYERREPLEDPRSPRNCLSVFHCVEAA